MSERKTTDRRRKLDGNPISIVKVPGKLTLLEMFETVLGDLQDNSIPTVSTGRSECDLIDLRNAYESVPGLMEKIVKLVLVEGGLEVVTEETDRVLFKFEFAW
ncbi:MAG TPA: hypothetical protein VEP90_04275 [Methylomirabilota bacterium]|nr:hypothetical protein [Methylomirabilota bacterium]